MRANACPISATSTSPNLSLEAIRNAQYSARDLANPVEKIMRQSRRLAPVSEAASQTLANGKCPEISDEQGVVTIKRNDRAAAAPSIQDFIIRNPDVLGGADTSTWISARLIIRAGMLAAMLTGLVNVDP